jgi:hypothetical protein
MTKMQPNAVSIYDSYLASNDGRSSLNWKDAHHVEQFTIGEISLSGEVPGRIATKRCSGLTAASDSYPLA